MITYMPGAGPYASNGAGTNPPNSSARISVIADVRPGISAYGVPGYSFTYNSNQINHLTSITNTVGTSENYTFNISNSQGLYSPFTNTTACGSTNSNCGSAGFLGSITRTGVNLTTSFTYDTYGYGDLLQVTFPYGGHIRWAYRNFTFTVNGNSRAVREAATRYLQKDQTASETTYNFYRDDTGDASRSMHAWFVLQDPSGMPGKAWMFWWDATSDPAWMPMYSSFTNTPDFKPFLATSPQIPTCGSAAPADRQFSAVRKVWLSALRKMDFSRPDAADENLLNRFIWYETKGYGKPYPGDPKVLRPKDVQKDDDDR